jgi:DNA-directed RNA polymerase I, II, and III subunit RPABC1
MIQNTTYFKRMILKFFEMFDARGYSYDRNVKHLDDKHVLTALKPDSERIMLLFLPTVKFNVRTAEQCVQYLESNSIKHVIIVYKESITCFARKVLDTSYTIKIEYFPASALEVNITNHVLQPRRFTPLSPSRAETFKNKWGINFPKMLTTDPICRFYNFDKGSIIEVERRDNTIIYRIVV